MSQVVELRYLNMAGCLSPSDKPMHNIGRAKGQWEFTFHPMLQSFFNHWLLRKGCGQSNRHYVRDDAPMEKQVKKYYKTPIRDVPLSALIEIIERASPCRGGSVRPDHFWTARTSLEGGKQGGWEIEWARLIAMPREELIGRIAMSNLR